MSAHAGIDPDDLRALRNALGRLSNRGYARDPDDVDIICGSRAWLRFNGDYHDLMDNDSIRIDGFVILKYEANSFPEDRVLVVDTDALTHGREKVYSIGSRTPVYGKEAATPEEEDHATISEVMLRHPEAIEFVPEFEVET